MEPKSSTHERRKHPRYSVGDNVLVFSSDTFGQILNISRSGLAYRFLTVKDDWIDTVARTALGILRATMTSGVFSSPPYCHWSSIIANDFCNGGSFTPTTTLWGASCQAYTGSNVDIQIWATCIGR